MMLSNHLKRRRTTEKFIPYEKLSKKEKRRRDAMMRGTWGALNPVTRKSKNPKAYDRRKARKWIDDPLSVPFFVSGEISLASGITQ